MPDISAEVEGRGAPARLALAARWLDATRAEAVGLLILLTGAVAATGAVWWASRPVVEPPAVVVASPPAASPSPSPSPSIITIHVVGAVRYPGVVRLPARSRVADALEAAGGPRLDADLGSLNLARPLIDGEQVVVAVRGAPVVSSSPTRSIAWRADGRLDLNHATTEDLAELPGIGPVIAERIVGWREANGGFSDVEQLREVAGIGERMLATLTPLVAV